ncbi:protein phosphatase 2C family protein [Striga asiatica]|uniref:Protein phosphatase 2C family protein n=1 Tax=Striga asiatica TaxID=4170 RepID=A0A5A7P4E0_STRAF|nr:protein phosphatase 2C family protein [Striga asiatica]
MAEATFSVTNTAPIGRPPAKGLARVIMSGYTWKASWAQRDNCNCYNGDFGAFTALRITKTIETPSIVTRSTHGLQEFLGCTVNAAFPLNWLHKHSCNLPTLNKLYCRLSVSIVQESDSRHYGLERLPVMLFACQR